MPENIYMNTVSQHNFTEKDENKIHVVEKRSGCCMVVVAVLFLLSLLANAVLAYLYFTTNTETTNQVMKCEPVTNCSNPDLPYKWVLNKDRIYVFQDDIMTWSHSRVHCQDMKGDLVIINSFEEQQFLAQQIVKFNALVLHWIGLTDSQIEGVWLWVDKTPLNNKISWWIYPPDDSDVSDPSGEDCAVLNGFLKGEKWGDISCLKKEKSICEIPCV